MSKTKKRYRFLAFDIPTGLNALKFPLPAPPICLSRNRSIKSLNSNYDGCLDIGYQFLVFVLLLAREI